MLDLNYWQEVLLKEKGEIEAQLTPLARVNPENKGDWEVKPTGDTEPASRDDVADELEEMDERVEIESELEKRLRDVNLALERIKTGKFGLCEVSGEMIEEERLKVNPAARTCKAHVPEEKNLPH
ncbi:MAG: TraR/DksA C4-type zinc finger protein [Patescibacteria group bacterium]